MGKYFNGDELSPLDDDTIRDFAIREVREVVSRAWLHELDETFHVDGVRQFDPHKDQPL